MMIHAPRRELRLFKNRRTLILLVALLTLMLAPGMRGRLFRARELTDGLPVGAPWPISAHLQAPRLVHLDPGSRLEGQSAPQGWPGDGRSCFHAVNALEDRRVSLARTQEEL